MLVCEGLTRGACRSMGEKVAQEAESPLHLRAGKRGKNGKNTCNASGKKDNVAECFSVL